MRVLTMKHQSGKGIRWTASHGEPMRPQLQGQEAGGAGAQPRRGEVAVQGLGGGQQVAGVQGGTAGGVLAYRAQRGLHVNGGVGGRGRGPPGGKWGVGGRNADGGEMVGWRDPGNFLPTPPGNGHLTGWPVGDPDRFPAGT